MTVVHSIVVKLKLSILVRKGTKAESWAVVVYDVVLSLMP